MLTAFKEGDPNGNSEQDEIPFDAGSGGLLLFMPAFGITNGWYVLSLIHISEPTRRS